MCLLLLAPVLLAMNQDEEPLAREAVLDASMPIAPSVTEESRQTQRQNPPQEFQPQGRRLGQNPQGMGQGRGPRWADSDAESELFSGPEGPGPRWGNQPPGTESQPGSFQPGQGRMGQGPRGPRMRQRVGELIRSPQRMAEMRQRNPHLADQIEKTHRLNVKLNRLLYQYFESTDSPQKKVLERKLRPLLQEEFELEMERQRMEIQFLEERLQKLKEIQARREKLKEHLMELHIDERLTYPPLDSAMDEEDSVSPELRPQQRQPRGSGFAPPGHFPLEDE